MAIETSGQGIGTAGTTGTTGLPPGALLTLPEVPRISWGAIIGGAVAALAIWLLLYTFGLAVGLSTVEPDDPGSVRSSGLFTGIWSAIAPLIALFVGGLVASRASGVLDRKTSAVQGLVLWGLTLLIGAWMLVTLLGNVLGGAASVGRSAMQAGGSALAQAGGNASGASAAFGIDASDALAPVNQRLRAEGKPPVQPEQLQAVAREVVQNGVRQGRVDRAQLVQSLAQNTALSRTDAEEVATRIEAQVNDARGRLRQVASDAQTGALKAADATGKAFWGVFGALLLGLIAAVAGSMVGVGRRQRELAIKDDYRRGTPVLRERTGHT